MPCVPTALASSLPLKAVRGGRGEAFSPAAELNTPELWARAEVAKEIEKAEEKNSGATCSPTSATQGAPSTQLPPPWRSWGSGWSHTRPCPGPAPPRHCSPHSYPRGPGAAAGHSSSAASSLRCESSFREGPLSPIPFGTSCLPSRLPRRGPQPCCEQARGESRKQAGLPQGVFPPTEQAGLQRRPRPSPRKGGDHSPSTILETGEKQKRKTQLT